MVIFNYVYFDKSYSSFYDKLLSFNDSSNRKRFIQNNKIIDDIFVKGYEEYLYGYPSTSQYLEDSNVIFPHNDILMLIVMLGVSGASLYLYTFISLINKLKSRNISFIYGSIFYMLFLGLLDNHYYSIMFIILLKAGQNRVGNKPAGKFLLNPYN